MRFLALGDSYTIGEGVAEHDRWPNHLVSSLRARGLDVHEPELVARTAWTTDELSDAIDAAAPRGPFDLVTLLVGVNDQYRSRPVASFAPEFERLLRRAVAFARRDPKRVMAISIPDWGSTPFAQDRDRARITSEIEQYNATGASLAAAAGVRWIDITAMTREMLRDPTLAASDGLHPSGTMYQRWAELFAPIADQILRVPVKRPRRA
ncbi:MAG TPA: SGNH/GDSL hydrolase family protein [Gemmatimonadaceae bacterium]|nr:SGNH/GDSL hydrolase family protein [Gemmatimonadaceae bacterium]